MTPQVIWILLILISLCYSANQHGKERSPENFWATLIAKIISILFLWWGGFWDCFLKG